MSGRHSPWLKGKKMVLGQHRRAVGTFYNRIDAEHALNELLGAGFPIDRISVVAKDADHDDQLAGAVMSEHVWYKALDGTATSGSITGSMLGAIGGCLVGLGLVAVPGVGPFVAVATSGTALAATLIGAGIGVATGGLIEALADLGITDSPARAYSDRFSQCEYLVMINGTDDEVCRADSILSRSYSSKVWVC
jgi:hypothetical protein